VFDHFEWSVASIEAARGFYTLVCRAIGADEIFFDEEDKSAGFGSADIVRLLLTEARPTQPKLRICFITQNRECVKRAHADALLKGSTCNGKPGYRDRYGTGYFAAFVLDPDGHNVDILYREPNSVVDPRS